MKPLNKIDHSFHNDIKKIWKAEKMLTEAIPKLIDKAGNEALKMSLAFHLAETLQHETAMAFIAKSFGIDLSGATNDEMKAILEEGDKKMSQNSGQDSFDKIIIDGARKVEEYEIAAYESLAGNIEASGNIPVASKLRSIQEEERQAENKLNFLNKNLMLQDMFVQ